MPNGGVPMHMLLFPAKNKDYVVYCQRNVLQIFTRQEWDQNKAQAHPIVELSSSEGKAIAGFLKYWIGGHDIPACHPDQDVNVVYDF